MPLPSPSALHPGVVSAAESAACAAQGQVLGALPQEARDKVVVAATAHTSVRRAGEYGTAKVLSMLLLWGWLLTH